MVEGLSHITVIVRDVERTARLLCEGLGADEVYDSRCKNFSLAREKFFVLGATWLVAMQGEPDPRSYRHIAFKVREADLAACESRLRCLGAEIRPARPRVAGEGQSLYFHDFDNNLFELHTGTLDERLTTYAAAS